MTAIPEFSTFARDCRHPFNSEDTGRFSTTPPDTPTLKKTEKLVQKIIFPENKG